MKKPLKGLIILTVLASLLAGSLTSVFGSETTAETSAASASQTEEEAEVVTEQCIFVGNCQRYFLDAETKQPLEKIFDYSQAVPGGKLTGRIFVQNEPEYGLDANLYLTVFCENDEARSLMYDTKISYKQEKPTSLLATPISKSAAVMEDLHLGTCYGECETYLVFTLAIPEDFTTEQVQKGIAGMKWRFRADEIASKDNKYGSRKTLTLANETWLLIIIISVVVLLASELVLKPIFRRRGRRF